jgi:hypothetical protein
VPQNQQFSLPFSSLFYTNLLSEDVHSIHYKAFKIPSVIFIPAFTPLPRADDDDGAVGDVNEYLTPQLSFRCNFSPFFPACILLHIVLLSSSLEIVMNSSFREEQERKCLRKDRGENKSFVA